jgi:hypothetical protein
MRTFREFLIESKSASLYHGTSLDNVHSILKRGYIQPSENGHVSTTRDRRVAEKTFGSEAHFVIDQQKVGHRQKITPTDWSHETGAVPHDKSQSEPKSFVASRGESEESVHGAISMKHVKELVIHAKHWHELTKPATAQEKQSDIDAKDPKMGWLHRGMGAGKRQARAKSIKKLAADHDIALTIKHY